MKITVDWDEAYPVYFPSEGGTEVEVPDDFMRKWKRVSKQYEELQNIMEEAHKAAQPVVHATPPDRLREVLRTQDQRL